MYCSTPVSRLSSHKLTTQEARVLVDLIMSNRIPEDLPEDIKSFLTEMKIYATIKGEEKAVSKILRKLNGYGKNKKHPVFLRTRILRYFYEAIQEKKEKPSTPEKTIYLPPGVKIHIFAYRKPFFNFNENVPVRKVRVNYKTGAVYLETIRQGFYSCYSRKKYQTQSVKGSILTVQFEKLIGIFLKYHIINYHRYYSYNVHSESDYTRIYGVFITLMDFKNTGDRKSARYVVFRFKRNTIDSELERSETLEDILNLLGKDRKAVKNFLKHAGHNLKDRPFAKESEVIPYV